MVFPVRRVRYLAILSITLIFTAYYLMSASETWNYGAALPEIASQSKTDNPPKSDRPHISKRKEDYPVTSFIPLPTGTPVEIPKIQTRPKSEDEETKSTRLKRQAAVKASFVHSWEGYKKHAWMRDEVIPVNGGGKDTFGGWAATLVDSLDTLWIMGLKDDFEAAVKAIQDIDFTTTSEDRLNVFETTIRYLGGFLGAYDVSVAKYPLLLRKAVEVGDLLISCFDTPNRMPITRWDWQL